MMNLARTGVCDKASTTTNANNYSEKAHKHNRAVAKVCERTRNDTFNCGGGENERTVVYGE